ncbi:MAG: class I SAM-dependent methyltransferase [Bryobacterales bacterium]|nr:class I SAM-dependent methyltransferase [Bryobacterales bacterium]
MPAHSEDIVIRDFHLWYYNQSNRTWNNSRWMGVPVWKMPLDMWIYQEILFDVKPDVLIECGTWKGGSALFFAGMFDLIRKGRVITVDIQAQPKLPSHPRITYITGSSTLQRTVDDVHRLLKPNEKVMVVLDSDHSKSHVLEEMRLYGRFVSPGSYLVVEDTNVNGHPILPGFGPGPMEAVEAFLATHKNFTVDTSREKFGFTFNPRGFLRRV